MAFGPACLGESRAQRPGGRLMGDIADAMINGEMCPCGEYLGDGPGYQQFCSAQCRKDYGGGPAGREPREAPAAFKCPKKLRDRIEKAGFTLIQHETYHWTVRRDGKVVASWWPHKRKWRLGEATTRGNEEQFLQAILRLVP